MMNYNELLKAVEETDTKTLDKIVKNKDEFDAESATLSERIAIIFFNELSKALNTKDSKLVLQVNDATTRAKVKTVTIAYYKTQNVNIQIYAKSHYCAICTTCKDAYRTAILEAVKRESNKATDKTAFEKVEFENAVDVIKTIVARVQAVNNANKKEEEKEEKDD